MRKKIGILTFHCANNFGAVLQAYALRVFLQGVYQDADIQIIDYKCKETEPKIRFSELREKKGFLGAALHYGQIRSMNQKFDQFRAGYLNLSESCRSRDSLQTQIGAYRAVISGSDQVWNLTWSGNDDVYFQNFNHHDSGKFSYAASFGFERLNAEQVPFYRESLRRFAGISVREEAGKRIVEEQLGLRAERHIDPTLLLGAEEWRKIAAMPKIKGKYILVYMVPKQNSVVSYAERLRKETGLPIVMLSKNLKPVNAKHAGDSSPQEFLGWFANAEYVVTNSFHGTAFSLIFHKKFCIELNNSRGLNIRSRDLLEICGAAIHWPPDKGIIRLDKMDWETVEHNLQKERKKSGRYLSGLLCGD